jgi:hypothetical protein
MKQCLTLTEASQLQGDTHLSSSSRHNVNAEAYNSWKVDWLFNDAVSIEAI